MKHLLLTSLTFLTLIVAASLAEASELEQNFPSTEVGQIGVEQTEIDPAEPLPVAPVALVALGQLETAGTACFNWDESPVLMTRQQILIPVRTFVKRAEGSRVVRGSCQFALPLTVPADHRLVIRSIGLTHLVNLSAGTQSKAQLEVFYPGSEGPKLDLVEQATDKRFANLTQAQIQTELVTECGAQVTLRGNSNILLIGGEGHSTAKLDGVQIEYELAPCEVVH